MRFKVFAVTAALLCGAVPASAAVGWDPAQHVYTPAGPHPKG